MRWFLAAALTAALILDVWFAGHIADQEIGSATKYHEIEKYQQHPIEGPFIVGARAGILSFLAFAENNEGAITAISTLAIAIFTVILAVATIGLWKAADQQKTDMRESLRLTSVSAEAAKKSADTAERQASDFRAMQSARLHVDFVPEIKIGVHHTSIHGMFKIRNVGNTVASNISIGGGSAHSGMPPQYGEIPPIPPTPNPAGPSLTAGDPPLEYPFDHEFTTTDPTRWYFSIWIAVSYRDTFDQPKIFHTPRYVYDSWAKRKRFTPSQT